MPRNNANSCELEYTINEVEIKQGKKGPWAVVKGHYTAEDRDGNTLKVDIRCTAFGVLAERCAAVKGETVNVRMEMGGWGGADSGKVWPDYTLQSISRPWGKGNPTHQPLSEHDSGGMKRGAPAPQQEDDESLPF